MRYLLTTCLLALASIANANQGIFEQTWVPRNAETFSNYTTQDPATDPIDVVIDIDFSDTISKVLPTLFGNNLNGWMKSAILTNQKAHDHMKRANMTYLRLPGGNWSNQWMWDESIPSPVKDNYASTLQSRPNQGWARTTEELFQLTQSVNAIAQPCVNYSLARFYETPDRIARAASYAASWVRDWNVNKGRAVPYWEVGNENYGSWQSGFEVTGLPEISGAEYGRDFRVFVDSMKSADPTIKIGAQVVEEDNGNASGGFKWWLQGVLPEVMDQADFLILHEYFTWAPDMNDVTVDAMLSAITRIRTDRENIQAAVEKYTDYPGDHLAIAMTEYNVRAGTKNTSFVSTLFITMALGEFVKEKYGLVNLWDVTNNYNGGNDHGTLSKNHDLLDDYTPQGNFFAYFFMNRFLGDVMLNQQSADYKGLYVYSTRFSSGEAGLVVVNPQAEARTLDVNFSHFETGSRAYWYTIQGDSALDRSFEINGEGPTLAEYGPTDYHLIPPRSTAVGSDFVFTAPPWSANYILIESAPELPNSVQAQKLNSIHNLKFSLDQRSEVKAFNLEGKPLSLHWNNTDQGYISPSVAQYNGILMIRYKNQSWSVLNVQ